jgi:hypothetical protein
LGILDFSKEEVMAATEGDLKGGGDDANLGPIPDAEAILESQRSAPTGLGGSWPWLSHGTTWTGIRRRARRAAVASGGGLAGERRGGLATSSGVHLCGEERDRVEFFHIFY